MPHAPQLADPELFRQQALIGGAWVDADSGSILKVVDPATSEPIGIVPNCAGAETEAAIASADRAFAGWRSRTGTERAEILMRWFNLMQENREDLARIMTWEQGKPLAEARGEIDYAASFIRWFSEEARRNYGETIPGTAPQRRILVVPQPIGVTAAITPWNFPAAMITRKAAPALAAGCTVVIKPSELTPYSALALGVLAERAGLPPGAINIVTGDAAPIGGALTSSKTVRKISFTGSTPVGKLLMRQSADTVKRISLELGGNAPLIVFDDADLEKAVAGAMASKFRNGGQTCVCANRIYVQDAIHDRFVAALGDAVAALKTGSGFEAEASIGPMINEAALQKIEAHISDATAKGAELAAGGKRIGGAGSFFEPTLLTGATSEMRLANEETFGPVAPIFRFSDEEEVIAEANATDFGLAAYVFTSSLSRGMRISEALESGMVGLNTGGFATEVAPFGGVKQSGLGREGARQGLREFIEEKTIHMDID